MYRECQTCYCDCADITHIKYRETILMKMLILLLSLVSLVFKNKFLAYRVVFRYEQFIIIRVSDTAHCLQIMIDIIDLTL